MDDKIPVSPTLAKRIGHELREYAEVTAYLYVCLGALILYKMAILSGQGIAYTPFGLAIVKAVILGKFVLVGNALKVGGGHEGRSLAHVIARKSALFLLLLLVLSVAEECIVGAFHGRSISASLADVAGGTLLQIVATCFIMLLVLIPYLTFRELEEAIGEGKLRQILFEHPAAV
jgi:hypothetical protein